MAADGGGVARKVVRLLEVAGKLLLAAATLLCLASMGGAMLYAFPVLVPLHWLAARSSRSPAAVGAWALLAGLSLFEAGWMLTYVATGHEAVAVSLGVVALAATITLFLRASAPPASV